MSRILRFLSADHCFEGDFDALHIPIAALICLAPACAQAVTCESSFVKGGNPLTGLCLTAQVVLPDLTPVSAIGQVGGDVLAKSYDVLATEAEGGSTFIGQPKFTRSEPTPGVGKGVSTQHELTLGPDPGADASLDYDEF